jgi:hypothetical protein
MMIDSFFQAEGERQSKEHFQMLRRYYEKHGYNPDSGTPLPKTLSRLGIPEIGKRLAEDGPYPFWDGPPSWDLVTYPKGGTRE